MKSLDRNTIIGFVLIGILLIVMTIYNQPTKEQQAAKRKSDSLEYVRKKRVYEDSLKRVTAAKTVADTIKVKTGVDSNAIKKGPERFYTIENENLKATISSFGGYITSVELKKFKQSDQKSPLVLFNKDSTRFYYLLIAGTNEINTSDLVFTSADSSFVIKGKENRSLRLRTEAQGKVIEQVYSLSGDSNMVNYELRINGTIADLQNVVLNWRTNLNQVEHDWKTEMTNSAVYIKPTGEDAQAADEGKTTKVPTYIDWVSFKQQYFNSTLISNSAFENGSVTIHSNNHPGYLKTYEAYLSMNYKKGEAADYKMRFYFGPNDYYKLKSYDIGLEKTIPTGFGIFKWFAGPVNKWFIIPLFHFFNQFIQSYGIIILIITIIIKIILYPLTYRSMVSAAKMRVLKPELDELREKYKDDQGKFGQEQLKLFRRAGVSPLGGCIPTLLQLPILVAMYSYFPGSIELRQQHFLWAKDLSTYDSIYNFGFAIPFYGDHISLFTLLMTVSSILFAIYNNQLTGATGQMKWMAYIFPVMLLGIFNNFAAALTYYYFLQNIVSFIQQWIIQRFVLDEAAIHAQIQENKKKTPKKGGFMDRLERMQREQKDLQRNRKK